MYSFPVAHTKRHVTNALFPQKNHIQRRSFVTISYSSSWTFSGIGHNH